MTDAELAARIHVGDDPELRLLRDLLEAGGSLRAPWRKTQEIVRQQRHGHVQRVGTLLEITQAGRAWVARACDANVRLPESLAARHRLGQTRKRAA